jgi:uncharacterized protein (DUF58 family)
MLKENKNVIQSPGEDRRRWFSDRRFDLLTWENSQRELSAFQLCYDIDEKQKIITWNGRLDVGHGFPELDSAGGTPRMVPAGPIDFRRVVPDFFEQAKNIDSNLVRAILEILLSQKECPLKKSEFFQDLKPKQTTVMASKGDFSLKPKLINKARAFRISDHAIPERKALLPEELLKKVKKIEITTRRIVQDMMGGQYKSHFKGHGVQFSEHRVYVPGDDIRHIDWKVSARTREPLIKKFEEERELTVLLIVDVSSSEHFASGKKLKNEISAELAGMIAYAASQTGDKVGALLFADQIEKMIIPKRGKSHVLRIIRDLLSTIPKTSGTNLNLALESARRVLKHSSVVFVISDFIDQDYEIALKRLSKEHDVVAIWIQDPKEKELPKVGSMVLVDPESGQRTLVDLASFGFKKWYQDFQKKFQTQTKTQLQTSRVQTLQVSTQEDYGSALVKFFQSRSRRAR